MPNTPKIVTRSETTSSNTTENLAKGSKLTFAEMDSNFLELRNGSIGIVGDDSTGIDLAHGSTLKVAGTGGISTTVSGDTLTVDASSIVTSTLGDLTAIGSTLISPSNADITLDPAGTGNVVANADLVTPAITIHDNNISTNRSNDNLELDANGTGSIILKSTSIQVGPDAASGLNNTTITGGNNQSVALVGGSSGGTVKVMPGPGNGTGEKGDIYLTPGSSTAGVIVGDGSNSATISSNSTQDLKLTTNDGGTEPFIYLEDGANGGVTIRPYDGGTGLTTIGNSSTVSTGDSGGGTVSMVDIIFRDPSGLAGAGRHTFNAIEIPFSADGSTSSDMYIGLDGNADPYIHFNRAGDLTNGAKIKTLTGSMTIQTDGANSSAGNIRIQAAGDITLAPSGVLNLGSDTIVVSGNRMYTDQSNEDMELLANGAGNISLLSPANMNSNKIVNVTDPTANQDAATKAYVDTQVASAGGTGDLSIIGSTISAPSNADLTLTVAGTGAVSINADLSMPAIEIHDNNITGTRSNEDINVTASGTGQIVLNNNTTVDGTMTATQFEGDLNGAILLEARNVSGVTIYKGQAVYVNGLSGNTPTVILADASDPAKMPALGVAKVDINNNATDEIVTLGNLYAIDTSASNQVETGVTLAVGDVLYISATDPGKLTNVAPAGESNQIQNIGSVVRVSPNTNMTFKIHGAGRSNATPALDDGNIFIGNASNQTTTTSLQTEVESYSINNVVEDTTPQLGGDLDVNGNAIKGSTVSILGATGELMITATENGPVALRYDNNLKLTTKSDGVDITGELQADSLDIDGNADITGTLNTHTIPGGTGTLALTSDITGTGDITFVGSTMSSPSNANFTIETAGTGKIILTGLTFPDTDGTADQILGTNGSGVLSFRDPTAINIDGGVADSVYTSVPTIDGGIA